MVSSATFDLREEVFDLRFQYKRKTSRGPREPRIWLHDHQGLLPRSNQPGQQDDEDAIGVRVYWPFHLWLEDDALLAQEGIFGDQLSLASAKIGEGGQRQGGPERFGPTSPRERDAHPDSHPSAARDVSKHESYKKLLHHMRV
jgi:hypothetical protein